MKVTHARRKARTILEELEIDASKELAGFRYSRDLLNEIRLGHGKAYKELKEAMEGTPEKLQRFKRHHEVEKSMASLRANMMWVKDSKSRVRHVDSEQGRRMVFTDPMATHTIPSFPPIHPLPRGYPTGPASV
eukprot:TRINITY_DN7154_c0_g1_i1.p1 TRINITY_DN7154_c0_g1~~TRINITY_DN7154_c0_g1_i1.p1  ORF type:complete len:133 (-),score=25.28 TRINITY_DN7154_c0_g1_i1:55-453(-)